MKKNDYYYEDYRLAQYYDTIYSSINHDIKFWLEICEGKKDILELACGTGRVTIPLYDKHKTHIDALDFSKDMLDEFKRKINNDNINLIQADMRNFRTNKRYDVILITSNSLNHILTYEDMDIYLSTIKFHLKKHGIIVFDILNPMLLFLIRNKSERYDKKVYEFKNNKKLSMEESSFYDLKSQINTVYYYYQELDNKENKLYNEIVQKIKVRMYFPQEMDYIIKRNELEIVHKYDWYDYRKFKGRSGEQIYILKKHE